MKDNRLQPTVDKCSFSELQGVYYPDVNSLASSAVHVWQLPSLDFLPGLEKTVISLILEPNPRHLFNLETFLSLHLIVNSCFSNAYY